jgi:hypothetical protein
VARRPLGAGVEHSLVGLPAGQPRVGVVVVVDTARQPRRLYLSPPLLCETSRRCKACSCRAILQIAAHAHGRERRRRAGGVHSIGAPRPPVVPRRPPTEVAGGRGAAATGGRDPALADVGKSRRTNPNILCHSACGRSLYARVALSELRAHPRCSGSIGPRRLIPLCGAGSATIRAGLFPDDRRRLRARWLPMPLRRRTSRTTARTTRRARRPT